jgi:hypothetical protein
MPAQRNHSNHAASTRISEVMPSATTASWSAIAKLVPASVTNARRGPCARLLATKSVTFGPGIRISTAVATTKAR